MNEKFAKAGSAGIEKVILHINGYFSQLIDMIASHGGDVLKVAIHRNRQTHWIIFSSLVTH